jgi:hypothetical protein
LLSHSSFVFFLLLFISLYLKLGAVNQEKPKSGKPVEGRWGRGGRSWARSDACKVNWMHKDLLRIGVFRRKNNPYQLLVVVVRPAMEHFWQAPLAR